MPKWKITYTANITTPPITEVTADAVWVHHDEYLSFVNETATPPVDDVPQAPAVTLVLKIRKDSVLAILNEDIPQS